MLFIVSCTSLPIENKNVLNIDLTIKTSNKKVMKYFYSNTTSNKNKELIIESLFKENILFSLDFDKEGSYELSDDLINSEMKYFCNSIIEEEKIFIESKIFKSNKTKNKKILVIYSEPHIEFVNSLKEKYPEELFFSINESNYEQKVAEILNTVISLKNYEKVSTVDRSIQIEHLPRVRNDISKIYFVTDYDIGKTIVPEIKSYTLNIALYSSSEIFHDAVDLKKLVDFEGSLVPVSNQLIRSIPSNTNTNTNIKNEIEKLLIEDFLTIEKVHQNNLHSKNIQLKLRNKPGNRQTLPLPFIFS